MRSVNYTLLGFVGLDYVLWCAKHLAQVLAVKDEGADDSGNHRQQNDGDAQPSPLFGVVADGLAHLLDGGRINVSFSMWQPREFQDDPAPVF